MGAATVSVRARISTFRPAPRDFAMGTWCSLTERLWAIGLMLRQEVPVFNLLELF